MAPRTRQPVADAPPPRTKDAPPPPPPAAPADGQAPQLLTTDQLVQVAQVVRQVQESQRKVETVEPESGEPDDRAVFVANGFVHWDFVPRDGGEPTRITLRRPMFGELRELRVSLEAVQAQVADARESAQRQADDNGVRARRIDRRLQAIARQLTNDAELTDEEVEALLAERRDLEDRAGVMGVAMRDAGNELRKLGYRLRSGWLDNALDQLIIVDKPDGFDWPAWAADENFVSDLLYHWQHRPLGRGSKSA